MSGTFILSLDCEGKWGVAERLAPRHLRLITRENLIRAYGRLLDLFDRFQIPATFAFVMAFALTERERRTFAELFRDVDVQGVNWLRFYRDAEERGDLDGWFCPEAFDMVQGRQIHEIASHGFSHLPLREDLISDPDAELELQSTDAVARVKGVVLETLVYPRNQVGFEKRVADHGYIGFRSRIPRKGNQISERLRSIAREVNVFKDADDHLVPSQGLIRIPAGQIFNWRTSFRTAIPPAVTRARWRSITKSAIQRQAVSHLWLHPHNIVTSPGTFDVLETVVRDVARQRDNGNLTIMTQAEYARTRLSNGST